MRAKTGLGAKSLGMLNESKRAAADSFYRQASATVIPNRPGHRSGHEGVVLTTRQQKILEFIHAYTAERGFGPSIRDIGEAVGGAWASTAGHGASLRAATDTCGQSIVRGPPAA